MWLAKPWSGSTGPGAQNPGTEFKEAQWSGLFGARPQAAGKGAKEEVLLAGFGELSQPLLLLLELGVDREGGSAQGPPSLNLCPAQPRHRMHPDPKDPVQTLAKASFEPQKPKLKSQGACPLNPGNLSQALHWTTTSCSLSPQCPVLSPKTPVWMLRYPRPKSPGILPLVTQEL